MLFVSWCGVLMIDDRNSGCYGDVLFLCGVCVDGDSGKVNVCGVFLWLSLNYGLYEYVMWFMFVSVMLVFVR